MLTERISTSIQENNESLKSPVEPVKSTSALTSYAESAPAAVLEENGRDGKLAPLRNPYEPQDMRKVLVRSYKVAEFSWDTEASGTLIGDCQFPDLLLEIENIVDKLAQFRWLRSDVEVEIKVNATPFHIGSLNISYCSHSNVTNPALNLFNSRLNNRTSVVMSVSSVNSIKLKIPRTGPTLMDDVQTGAPCDGSIGTVFIDVLDELSTLSGETPSALKISVFANFCDPEVSGYGVSEVSPVQAKRKIRRLNAQKTKETTNIRKKSAEEAANKSKTGIISGIAEAAGDLAPIVAMTPFAEFAPLLGLGKAFAPFLQSLGLCKPMDVSKVDKYTAKPYDDMNYMHGLSYGSKLSAHPDAGLHDTNVSGLGRHKIRDIIRIGGHVLRSVIDASTATGVPFLLFPVMPSMAKWDGTNVEYIPTYMAQFSKYFKLWRGGLKFRLVFVTSQYTTARVRIMHLPNNNAPSDIEAFAGDIPSTVIDVRGTTEYEFTIPYIHPSPYLPCLGFYGPAQTIPSAYNMPNLPHLCVSLVNPVNIPDPSGNSKVHFHLYVGAAEDFQFGELIGYQFERPDAYEAPPGTKALKEKGIIKKKSLEEVFKRPFRPLIPATGSVETAMVLPEKITSVEEILKRPRQGVFNAGTVTSLPCQIDSNFGATTYSLALIVNQIIRLFQFYRGGTRYKIVPGTDVKFIKEWNPYSGVQEVTELRGCGFASGAVEVEVPWDQGSYCRSIYGDVSQDFDVEERSSLTTSFADTSIYWSVADDFQFGGLLPPQAYAPNGLPSVEKTDLSESVSSCNLTSSLVIKDYKRSD